MSPRAALAALLLLLLALRAPSLGLGFALDDYTHQAVLSGDLEHPSLTPASLYDFGTFDEDARLVGERHGQPFWVDPGLRIRFFRPLASASLALDHRLHGSDPRGYHLTSWLLFGGVLLLAHGLWRRLGLAHGSALLALAVYGLEDGSHSIVVGWIANRNSLLEALCLLGALNVALAGRGARSAARLTVATSLAALGVLAKESGVGGLAALAGLLLLAPTPELEATPARRRRIAASLALGLALLHVVGLALTGHGSNSAFYPVPWTGPAAFLLRLPLHLTVGLATCLGPFSADVAFMHPPSRPWLGALGLVLLLAVARPLLRGARAHPAGPFLALLAAATFLPQLVAPPSDRLVFVPLLGIAPLLALTLARLWSAGTADREARTLRLAAIVLGFSLLPLSAFASLAQQKGFRAMAEVTRASVESPDLGTAGEGPREVIVLQTPVAVMALNVGLQRLVQTGDGDARFWPLQAGRRPVRWVRTGPRSFRLESLAGPWLDGPVELVFRRSLDRPEDGRSWRAGPLEVTLADGGRALAVTLDRSLEDPGLRFMAWEGGAWVHVEPPAPGAARELSGAPPPLPLVP